MKKLKNIIGIFIVLLMALTVASCNNSSTSDIEGTINEIVSHRDSLDLNVKLEDNKNLENAVIYLELSDEDETEVISTRSLASTTDNQNLTFSSLENSTKYVLNLYATYNKTKNLILTKTVSTNDLGLDSNPIEISTVSEFKGISSDIFASYILMNDLDLEGAEIDPIFTQSIPFKGVFDGGNHTIKNFELNKMTYYNGLFGYIKGGSVKNLTISDATSTYVKSTSTYFGFVAGYLTGLTIDGEYKRAVIDNVTVKDVTVNVEATTSSSVQIGLIAGTLRDGSKLINSTAEGTITMLARYDVEVGGLVGAAGDVNIKSNLRPVIDNCKSDVTINFTNKDYNFNDLYVDNKLGLSVGSLSNADMKNTIAKGTINATLTKLDAQEYSKIDLYQLSAGGLAGYVKNGEISLSVSSPVFNITSTSIKDVYVGGLVGNVADEFASVRNSVVKEAIFNTNFTIDFETLNAKITEDNEALDADKQLDLLENNIHVNLLVGHQALAINNESYDFSDSTVLSDFVDTFNVYGLTDAVINRADTENDKTIAVLGLSKELDADTTKLNEACIAFLK